MKTLYCLTLGLAFLFTACTNGEGSFSLRQKSSHPETSSPQKGAVMLEKDAAGMPVRCWITSGSRKSWVDGSFTRFDTADDVTLYVSSATTTALVTANAWEQAFDLLGVSRETCLKLGRRQFDLKTNTWVDPPAPTPGSAAWEKIRQEGLDDIRYSR